MWLNDLFGFSPFGTQKHGKPDCATLKHIDQVPPIVNQHGDRKVLQEGVTRTAQNSQRLALSIDPVIELEVRSRLWGYLLESRIHLILLDALRRIAALSKVCSSVPSPIIPRWTMGRGSLASFLASFGSGLSVIGKTFVLAVSGSLPATFGDHPTRRQARASGSETTQALGLARREARHCPGPDPPARAPRTPRIFQTMLSRVSARLIEQFDCCAHLDASV